MTDEFELKMVVASGGRRYICAGKTFGPNRTGTKGPRRPGRWNRDQCPRWSRFFRACLVGRPASDILSSAWLTRSFLVWWPGSARVGTAVLIRTRALGTARLGSQKRASQLIQAEVVPRRTVPAYEWSTGRRPRGAHCSQAPRAPSSPPAGGRGPGRPDSCRRDTAPPPDRAAASAPSPAPRRSLRASPAPCRRLLRAAPSPSRLGRHCAAPPPRRLLRAASPSEDHRRSTTAAGNDHRRRPPHRRI